MHEMMNEMNILVPILLSALLCISLAALILLCVLLSRQKTIFHEEKQRLLEQGEYGRLLLERQKQHSEQTDDALRLLPTREESMQRQEGHTQQVLSALNHQTQTLSQRTDALSARFDAFGQTQEQRLHRVTATLDDKLSQNEQRIEKMRDTLSQSVTRLQDENSKKLEEMRLTVDEKLHATLDKRLGESFSLVNERLEQVYKGLGEMQTLANGVGDLKKVLTNVKTRGVWGEMQLGALLEQVLSPNQYDENVAVVPNASQRVEYAVKMPGKGEGTVYLPIDAKFPIEDYERLQSALDAGDGEWITAATQALHNAIKTEGKRIASKYIQPPYTTDFAIMFLPLEGLYAEALRCRGLAEEMQEKYRIVIAGPTTLTALLTSLQVGFRTLAIEKRSGEVWQLLSAVKTEFSRFSELLDTAQKRISSVSNSIEMASKKSRTITRKLKQVEALDEGTAAQLLSDGEEDDLPLLQEQE